MKNPLTATPRQDHVNTFMAAELLRVVFKGAPAAFAIKCNNIRAALGQEPVTEATIRRYCDGGRLYEQGPPVWFVEVVHAMWAAFLP